MSNEQKKAALNYGEIIDIPFPSVDSNGDESYIKETGNKMIERIMSYHPKAVLCQGEFTLAYYIISALMRNEIIVLAACSNRNDCRSLKTLPIMQKKIYLHLQ